MTVVDLSGHCMFYRTPVAFIPEESVRKSLIRARNLVSCVSWGEGPDFSHLVSEAGCVGRRPLRRGWRGELNLSIYSGKVRLYIPLYSGRNEISARNGISALTFKYKYGDFLQTFQT